VNNWNKVLYNAVLCNDFKSIAEAFANGASVEARYQFGSTILHLASILNKPNIAEWLLAHEADINAQNGDGYTALMLASRNGHIEMVSCLLAHKASTDIKNNNGETASDMAKGLEVQRMLMAARNPSVPRGTGCDFCNNFDFGSAKVLVEKYGNRVRANIVHAGGFSRFPKKEQFNFCPRCGKDMRIVTSKGES